jgi:hypothetical protein
MTGGLQYQQMPSASVMLGVALIRLLTVFQWHIERAELGVSPLVVL